MIERQKFSVEEEDELKHSCALALARVPHSDEMTDDPFRYLASQITAGQTSASQRKQNNTQPAEKAADRKIEHSAGKPEDLSTRQPPPDPDTATPSETSKRETIQTNATTPLTTPDPTPQETGKRFSDAGKRPVTAQPSHLRTEIKTFKGHAVYSFLKESLPTTRPQTAASKSLTHLPTLSKFKSKQNIAGPAKDAKTVSFGDPDFNKSLPALPQLPSVQPIATDEEPREKTSGISRMLRTIRLPRTQSSPIVELRTTSTDLSRKQKEVLDRSMIPNKHKFTFSLMFSKRNSTKPKRATVG